MFRQVFTYYVGKGTKKDGKHQNFPSFFKDMRFVLLNHDLELCSSSLTLGRT